jgi:signal peptidase I
VRILRQFLIVLLSVFLLHEVITSMVITTGEIGSRSMAPGLATGDRIFISRIPYGITVPFTEILLPPFSPPAHGDEILISLELQDSGRIPVISDVWDFFSMNSPFPGSQMGSWTRGIVVRRVIATGGDRVYLSGGQAFVQIGGAGDFLPESALSEDNYDLMLPDDAMNRPDLLKNYFTSTVAVPEGMVFVMPDNRAEALGSPGLGFISEDIIRGKVIGILRRSEP